MTELKNGNYDKSMDLVASAMLIQDDPHLSIIAGMASFKMGGDGGIEGAKINYETALRTANRRAAENADYVDDTVLALFLLNREDEAERIVQIGLKKFPESTSLAEWARSSEDFLRGYQEYQLSEIPNEPARNKPE